MLDPLSVRRLPGLGAKTGAQGRGGRHPHLWELRAAPDALLWPLFGRYTQRVRGTRRGHRRASGRSRTWRTNRSAPRTPSSSTSAIRAFCRPHLARLAELACERLRAKQLMAGCIGVKIRRHDFTTFTRQRAVAPPTHDGRTIANVARELLGRWLANTAGAKLRLLGVVLTDLSPASQLGLFEDSPPHSIAPRRGAR